MQEPDADFRERGTSSEDGFTSSAQHNASEALPPRWLELLAKLNIEVGPWVMPKNGPVATTSVRSLPSSKRPTEELPGRRWKVLLQRLLRVVIHREGRSDEPLHQSWPANDNAPTSRPSNVPGNRP
jgi:hypothetical protein